ncbi:MAG: phage tail tube protein [Melioribacteraceae bacterium]|jgi:predicted secreted protein|nr:phage tail tube protein [Melioribacteraceae bacterium]
MASNAFSGVGTVFNRATADTSNPTFAAIAEINSISGPNLSRDTIDVTSLDSTGGYREFIPGFRDGGEISLDMNFTHDGFADLKADFEMEGVWDYQIVFANTDVTTFDFAGIITAIGIAVPMDDKVTASVTIKISGPVTVSS